MILDIAGVLRDALAMAKRDWEVLTGVAGTFILVPLVAQAMFIAPTPDLPPAGADPAAWQAWLDALSLWARQNDPLLLAVSLVTVFGMLALFMLYADRSRPDVGTALKLAIGLLPRFVLLTLAITLPVNLGSLLLLVPGLYLKGRLLPIGPAFVAEQPLGVIAAWRRSFALTRGHGLVLMALACVPLLAGDLLALPFAAIGRALDGAPMANPVAAGMLDLCAGAARTLGAVAAMLIEIALYRRLSKGI